jgi:poly-gamma-glutamate synthesis protein (capsule biosynthesis protein)
MSNKFLLFPFFGLIVPFILYIIFIDVQKEFSVAVPAVGDIMVGPIDSKVKNVNDKQSEPIVFVGDILLARHVEYLLSTRQTWNPFQNSEKIFANAEHIVGNFESAIAQNHTRTPSYVTTFSVAQQHIPLLSEAGFTHLSLANNHSYDYGERDFIHTIDSLTTANLVPFGHPNQVATTSTTIISSGDYVIGILAINEIFEPMPRAVIVQKIAELALITDFKVAYVHWGEEYKLKHNQTQELLARLLIDAGIDVVIGHHPHVTQDIEIYNDKPIFYSLGNFLFDQYFSVDVQQGLAVSLVLSSSSVEYTITPVTSENSISEPHSMSDDSALVFLKNLSRRSDQQYADNIALGKLILPFNLATSTQTGMITQ